MCWSVTWFSLCVQLIEKYLQSTHAPTHSDYTMSVLDIFRVDREGERNSFQADLDNRLDRAWESSSDPAPFALVKSVCSLWSTEVKRLCPFCCCCCCVYRSTKDFVVAWFPPV